jgi:hypothetical protein
MTISSFTDKNHAPSPAEVGAALGPALPLWERMLGFIETTYAMPGEWSYGGKNYGWNRWYRKSGKALVSLYPQQGGLVAQVVLGKDQTAKALELSLGEKVGRLLRDTPQLHDGKWLFIPVSDETDARDVEQLLLVKKRPAKKN